MSLSEISYDEKIKATITIEITTDREMIEEYGSIESMVSANLDGSDFQVNSVKLN